MKRNCVYSVRGILASIALAALISLVVTEHALAQSPVDDQVVVIVSSINSIEQLSREQLEDIFLGQTQSFPNGSQVVPVDQAEGSNARRQFYEVVLGRTAAQVRSHWAKLTFTGRGRPPRSVSSTDEILALISQDARILSYIEKNKLSNHVKVVFE